MLKSYGYDGVYNDENLSVSVLLENPLEHGLDATQLVFSVTLRAKNSAAPKLEDFTFYVMDEADRMYNTQSAPHSEPTAKATPEDEESARCPDILLHADFRHDFLFQDLRIAFYYRLYQRINIIALKH